MGSEGNSEVPAVNRREVSNIESIANKSQIIEEKYSPTEFSALLEQELVIGHYLKSQLGERSSRNLSRSDQTRNLSRSDQMRSLPRSDQIGNMSRSDQLGNMSRSDQLGNMSRSDQIGNMSRSAPNHQETGDDLQFSRWESEVCFMQSNSLQHRPRTAAGNPEIVIVDYGQE